MQRAAGQPEQGPTGILRRSALILAPLAVLALPFLLRPRDTGPRPAGRVADLPARKLVLISPHWEGIRREFGLAFTAWTEAHEGYRTELEWLDMGGTSDALRYVRSEFTRAPDGIGIDIFFGGGIDPYLQLSKEGLLSPCRVPEDVLARIPATMAGLELYDPQRRWFGACLGGFGIIYNKKVCRLLGLAVPATWEDLGRPAYVTWVGSGDPRSSGSVHMVYEIILQAYGWERGWATIMRMAGNTRNFARAGSEIPKDTAVGEVACGMAIDVYAWRQVAEVGAERMGFCLPDGLTVVNPDGIALLKGAPNREVAEQFIAFVLSEAGQKLWVLKRGAPGGPRDFELDRVSVIPGFGARCGEQAAVTYDPFTWQGGFTYDAQKGSRRWTVLNDLIGAAIIDTHGELTAAWRAVREAAPQDPGLAAFTRPPLAEAELLRLAGAPWDDPEFRAGERTRWTVEARERYRRVAGGG